MHTLRKPPAVALRPPLLYIQRLHDVPTTFRAIWLAITATHPGCMATGVPVRMTD